MPVQLPPPRPLPDPERMLGEILSADGEPPATDRRRAPVRVVGALLVAAAVAAVAAIALPVVLHRGDDGTIAASPSTGPSRSGTAGPPHPAPGRLPLGDTVTFEHFAVTVRSVSHSPMFGILVDAKVCVRSLPPDPTGRTTRVSWEPWSVANGQTRAAAELRQAPPGVAVPANLFPRERYLRVGQCASGWIPFNADEHSDVVAVLYANSLGDSAAWAGK